MCWDDETKHMENQILIHVLFQTSLVNLIIQLPRDKAKMNYDNNNRQTDMGYMAYLIELGKLLYLDSESNEDEKEFLFENQDWPTFIDTILKPKLVTR